MGSHKKPTAKQLRAIDNIVNGWKITKPELLVKPKTIIQAQKLITKLIAEAASIKAELNGFWQADVDEQLQDCMAEAGFFH